MPTPRLGAACFCLVLAVAFGIGRSRLVWGGGGPPISQPAGAIKYELMEIPWGLYAVTGLERLD